MEPREPAKAAFHWALAGVFVPGLGLLAAPMLAMTSRGGTWGRRLAILAVVDLFVLASFVQLVRHTDGRPEPKQEGPRIGVLFEEGTTTVKNAVEGWPAAEAGLRAGDVIRAVDGVAATSQEELIRTVRESERERVLSVERAGARMDVRVTPRHPRPRESGLFEAAGHSGSVSFQRTEIIGYSVAAAVVFAAWLASRRRPRPRVWRGFFLAVGFFVAGSLGASSLVQFLQGGMSRGGLLIAMMLGHSALALGGILASRWLASDRPPEPPPAMSPTRALVLAVYYTVTVYPRAGIALLAMDLSLFGGAAKPPDALETFATTLHGPLGIALFALAVAVVGPIAEEIVFRGLLLPRLAARIGRSGALAATSLIFGCMHANYGLYAALTVVLGWMLGWARLSSGGLTAPIALHMILNGVVTTIFFLREA